VEPVWDYRHDLERKRAIGDTIKKTLSRGSSALSNAADSTDGKASSRNISVQLDS